MIQADVGPQGTHSKEIQYEYFSSLEFKDSELFPARLDGSGPECEMGNNLLSFTGCSRCAGCPSVPHPRPPTLQQCLHFPDHVSDANISN